MFPHGVSASLLSVVVVVLGVGCSGSPSQPPTDGDPAPAGDCSNDPSGKAFHVGMSVTGTTGHVVELLEATPTKPSQDANNSWRVKITDANGSVDGMTVTAQCNMKMAGGAPSHGCGGGLPPVKSLGNGEYQVSPLYFNMPGDWELVFTIVSGTADGGSTDNAVTDTARIATCIPR